jgi:hypothetical protein
MKKSIAVILMVLFCISVTGCRSYFDAFKGMESAYQEEMDKILDENKGNNKEDTSDEKTKEEPSTESSSNQNNADESTANAMNDGYINGTNAKAIEASLKSMEEYNWWDDHSLVQSEINKEWSVYCANNEYNTYTKSYDLYANETLEIELAKFKTYDFDYDYLLLCASFFDTDLINAEEVKEWVRGYDQSKQTVEKNFGDAEFTLSYHEYDDECYVELYVCASGNTD